MNKPVIRWKPIAQEDPSDRSNTIYVPHIVERNDTKDLADVVYSAIDRGLIAGLKTSAAKSIAEGILIQLGEELNAAHGVKFGDFFAVRSYLTGTVDGLTAGLTAENKLSTKFVAGSALRQDRANFTFRNVLETGDTPYIDEVQAAIDNAESGIIVDGQSVQLIGSNLKLARETDKVVCYTMVDGEKTNPLDISVSRCTQNSNILLEFAPPEGGIPPNHRYGFEVVKTIEVEEGVTTTVTSNLITAECVAA
ncbi:MAG: hypothetical protein IKF72_12460 [Kiritimatiellae bacterium]|nr:hypothetical protein [Kiritimatiellia bacterium]